MAIAVSFINPRLTHNSFLPRICHIQSAHSRSNYKAFQFRKQRRNFSLRILSMATQISIADAVPTAARNDERVEGTGENDLLIVGPGELGRLVAQNWFKDLDSGKTIGSARECSGLYLLKGEDSPKRHVLQAVLEEHPSCKIVGETRSTSSHEELSSMGIIPCVKGSIAQEKFPYVIFCAPPTGNNDYPGDVRSATLQWNGKGAFLFTSSSAVYDRSDNGLCFEDSPTVPIGNSSRTDVLLKAEKEALQVGGNVVRLAGLYNSRRGVHLYYLEKGTVESRADYIFNIIHYEDAASLCSLILKKRLQGQIFVGCDNHPLSRQELMESLNKSNKFSKRFQGFEGQDGPLGKKLDNTRTCKELEWRPKYTSFEKFLELMD